MIYSDEKDYVMRMIKEAARVFFKLIFGKDYVQVELEEENKYSVSGQNPDAYKAMVDRGEINEAENMLLEDIDYGSKEEVTVAIRFYLYVSEKEEKFLTANNYSEEEVLEGVKRLAERAGYGNICEIVE